MSAPLIIGGILLAVTIYFLISPFDKYTIFHEAWVDIKGHFDEIVIIAVAIFLLSYWFFVGFK